MNPYRLPSLPEPLRARVSSLLRPRSIVRLAILLPLGAAYACGWTVGRAAPSVSVQVSVPPASPPAPAPDAKEEPAAAAPDPSPAEPARTRYAITPAQARATIAARARVAVAAVTHRDMKALAGLVDPDEGLEIGSLDGKQSMTLSPADLSRCFADHAIRALGDGEPATCGEIWREHLSGPDFARAPHVDYNLPSAEGHPASMVRFEDDDLTDLTLLAHRDSIVVQYVVRRPENDVENSCANHKGWSTLRLVFDPRGEQWRLRAAVFGDFET